MENKPEISIIIPAYNEEARLPATLKKTLAYLESNKYNFELIVVDDGSKDRTPDIVKEYIKKKLCVKLLINPKQTGKGYSVKRGMLAAGGDYLFFSDADLSTPIEEIEKLLTRLRGGCDVAFSSRALSNSQVIVREAWYRDTMGKIFGFLVRRLALPGVRDSQCGFKGFRRDAAMKLFSLQRLDGFAFDVEILFIARKLGFRLEEIPVRWVDSPKSKVNPIIDSMKMLIELFRIRINDYKGVYRYEV